MSELSYIDSMKESRFGGDFFKELLPLLAKRPLVYSQEPWSSPRPDHDFSDKEPQLVILLSDESHKPVNYKNCLVFRNYINPQNASENERAIPLPPSNGFAPIEKRFSERKFYASFSGFCGNKHRKDMVIKLLSLRDNFNRVYVNATEKFGEGLSAQDYSSIMSETMLAICPFGGSYETFRLTEALKAGCIPVQVRRPMQWYDPSDLIIWIDTWEDLDKVFGMVVRTTPKAMIERSELCKDFYQRNLSPLAVANYINKEWAQYLENKAKP